ncbi:MAG: mechanosensitive ion channel family protein [Mariprofundaceae bacterium]
MQETWTMLQSWSFLDIPLTRWLFSSLILFVAIVAQKIVLKTFHILTQKLADRTATELDNLLLEAAEKPASWLIFIIGIIATVHILNPPIEIFPMLDLADQLGRIISISLGIWFLWRLTDGLAVYFKARAAKTETSLDDQLVPFIAKTLKIFIVITGVLVVAQNLGYSITGLIASLGIGGIAIAMAAKDTIANIFGSIMILIDRPFTVGDWIKTSEFEGVVEEVGFRSTRIRTFAKTLVNVPNSSLANMVIDNIHAMPKRRIKMRIGITYSTTPARMQAAIEGIEKILCEHPGVDQDFSLVKFDEFEDCSLSIFLYYFSKSTKWAEYLQVRQEVNLQIMELLESLELEFAFPTRTVHLEQQEQAASLVSKKK